MAYDLEITSAKSPDELHEIFESLIAGHIVHISQKGFVNIQEYIAVKDNISQLIVTDTGRIIPLACIDMITEVVGHRLAFPVSARALGILGQLYPHLDFPFSPINSVIVKLVPDINPADVRNLMQADIKMGTEICTGAFHNGNFGIIAYVDEENERFFTSNGGIYSFKYLNDPGLLFTGRTNLPFFACKDLQKLLETTYGEKQNHQTA